MNWLFHSGFFELEVTGTSRQTQTIKFLSQYLPQVHGVFLSLIAQYSFAFSICFLFVD